MTKHIPDRTSDVAAWLKAQRDLYPTVSNEWGALNTALADYRRRADYGYPLTEVVQESDNRPATGGIRETNRVQSTSHQRRWVYTSRT